MIVPIATQNDFAQCMQMNEGYMVNKTFKTEAPHTRYACAHDIVHHNSKTCRLSYSKDYPKFYASTFQEAQVEAQQRWGLSCEVCPNCV